MVNRCGWLTTPSGPLPTCKGFVVSRVSVRRCRNQQCERYHRPYRPEEERWALPHGEFGLDAIALVGSLRYTSHRSVPEIHQTLRDRGISIAERTVTHLLQRYEELVALSLSDQRRLQERFKEQGRVILAIDGLQPDVGLRPSSGFCVTASPGKCFLLEVCGAACEADLASLLREVQEMVDVPIRGVISDGDHSIEPRSPGCVARCPAPVVPLPRASREAAKPVYEADRHAKKELKKHLRGIRPIERAVEQRHDAEA